MLHIGFDPFFYNLYEIVSIGASSINPSVSCFSPAIFTNRLDFIISLSACLIFYTYCPWQCFSSLAFLMGLVFGLWLISLCFLLSLLFYLFCIFLLMWGRVDMTNFVFEGFRFIYLAFQFI